MFLRTFLANNLRLFVVLGIVNALVYFMLARYGAAVSMLITAAYLVANYQSQYRVHMLRVAAIRTNLTTAATPIMVQLARENPSIIFSSTTARRNPHR